MTTASAPAAAPAAGGAAPLRVRLRQLLRDGDVLLASAFAAAALLGSFLLFLVEPLSGKLLLPIFGGTPAVWNACMLAFQILLLAAYAYAHVVSTRLTLGRQVAVHGLVLIAACAGLPLGLRGLGVGSGLVTDTPVVAALALLAATSGPVFFAVGTTPPLVASWFARLGFPNPYLLYVASNVGSFAALLAYPFVIEARLTLGAQAHWWSAAFAPFALLILALGLVTARRCRTQPAPSQEPERADEVEPMLATAAADTDVVFEDLDDWLAAGREGRLLPERALWGSSPLCQRA
jgi:hypothetical protein